MASIVISGDVSGACTISAPSAAGTPTLTLPTTSGTILTTASTTGISGSAISSGIVGQAFGGTGTTTGYYGFKNRIINGAMVIDQRNAGASVTPANLAYTLDRWRAEISASSKFTVQQSTTAPAGFNNSLLITSSSAYTVGAADYFAICQPIEGYNIADLGFGTANAKTVTLSFWVRSSVTGTYSAVLVNQNDTRVYPFTYTINSANTFEQKSVTITGDTTGTWLSTNGAGIRLNFYIGLGTNFQGSVNAWNSGTVYGASGTTNLVSTNGATFYITGVQLEVGSTATSFDYRPYQTELNLCYRYCYALYKGDNIYYGIAGYYTSTDLRTQIQMPVNMRTTPTISYTGYSQVWRNGTSDANNVNGWSVTLSCPNTVHLTSTNSMSGTAGQIGWLYAGGGGQLIFLAEL